jgi:hypothetical protein
VMHGGPPTFCRRAAGARLERTKADWAATWLAVMVLGSADRSWSSAHLRDTANQSDGFAAMFPLSPSRHPGATWKLTPDRWSRQLAGPPIDARSAGAGLRLTALPSRTPGGCVRRRLAGRPVTGSW